MHDVCTESTNIQAFRFAPDLTMACNVMLHYVLLIDTLLVLFRKYSTLSRLKAVLLTSHMDGVVSVLLKTNTCTCNICAYKAMYRAMYRLSI